MHNDLEKREHSHFPQMVLVKGMPNWTRFIPWLEKWA
jgi:hypothetical protein